VSDQRQPTPETPDPPPAPDQQQPTSEAPAPSASSLRPRITAALPFIITAVASVLLSLLLQWLLLPPSAATPPPAFIPTAASTPVVVPTSPRLEPTPALSAPEPSASLLRLAILDLEAQDRRLRSALYLLRAVAQLDDALVALQANQLAEADRALLLVYRSLDQAYAFSAEQEKGPIDTFRLQLSQIRDDLPLRPEGADRRLRQLRGLILSLVDEGG
jgi:hypothetical protein